MTTYQLKMGVEPSPETLCISNIPQMMCNVQHNTDTVNQILSQSFTESAFNSFEVLHLYYYRLNVFLQLFEVRNTIW